MVCLVLVKFDLRLTHLLGVEYSTENTARLVCDLFCSIQSPPCIIIKYNWLVYVDACYNFLSVLNPVCVIANLGITPAKLSD